MTEFVCHYCGTVAIDEARGLPFRWTRVEIQSFEYVKTRILCPERPCWEQLNWHRYGSGLTIGEPWDWKRDDLRYQAIELRDRGTTRRGLGDGFYRLVARGYTELLAEGNPHPVKALAKMFQGSISSASRWVKEARSRGLITEENT